MGTELITVDSAKYEVLDPRSDAAELIRSNMAGDEVGVGDLTRIRVPAGGGTAWVVPSVEGEQSLPAIEGIIIHVARRRAYWESTDPSGDPPDCSSNDCVRGVGNPGGDCGTCPFNEFGSSVRQDGKPGRGKRCKESTLLFLLREGGRLPDVVVVSPASIKPVKQYRLQLPVPYFACMTRLELRKQKNKDGISYAEVVPTFVGRLEPAAVESVKNYAESMRAIFAATSVDHDEVDGE